MTPLLADELDKLGVLKEASAAAGRDDSAAKAEFKQHQTVCLDLMEAQRSKSHRAEDGTLYTRCDDRVKGQVEDRRKYVRWALEGDSAVQEFIEDMRQKVANPDADDIDGTELVLQFYDAVMNTELVKYQADGTHANAQARAHVDDEQPLPPGLNFRPDPYIQQRRS